VRYFLWLCVVSLLSAVPAAAQPAAASAPVPQPAVPPAGIDVLRDLFQSMQGKAKFSPPDHWQLVELVDLAVPGQTGARVFADQVDIYLDRRLMTAQGNVTFTGPDGRISADKIEFNIGDGTAIFYDATGFITMPEANRAEFGNQDPDIYFWGTRIDKRGPRKYRITRGGFSACVQPTPRWEITSTSIDLNLDDYALARSTILRVKGVPLLYLPAIYYPLQEDQRSTGFLMPTYGTSTLRGTSISNAFFWAIARSQDATVFHDWFARAGQGMGGEYRYVARAGSSGDVRFYRFNQRQSVYTSDGQSSVLPENSSFEIRSSVVHAIRPGLNLRGRVDYASDLVTQQLYQQNVYRASSPIRNVEGSFSGSWGALSANALYQRTEVFSTLATSTLSGSSPRVNAAVAPTRLLGLPLYGSMTSEYANLPYRTIVDDVVVADSDLARVEIAPTLRVPLSTLSFLSLNSTASYRTTHFNRSRDEAGNPSTEPIGRSYFALKSDVVGPVFTKIWDTPNRVTIDRMKHNIEPVFSVDYVTDIGNAARLPLLSHLSDVVVGGSTRLTYGLNNRFFYRQRPTGTTRGSSQEFLTIGVQQTYYSNPEASRWDYTYLGATSRTTPVDLSPVAVTTRFSPSTAISANGRLEYDVSGLGLQTVSLGGSVSSGAVTANATFSRVVYTSASKTTVLALSDTMRFLEGRATGTYSLSWDLARGYVVQQSISTSYLAQCCGVQLNYQQYNYPDLVGFPVNADRRLTFGFVLAGLGTFTNFFGQP
jgi:LPS-assembly protein